MPEPSPAASRSSRRARWLGIGAAAALLGLLAALTMQPTVAGQFHDDGLYLTTAGSIAGGEGYRHISLPTAPVQTKYPPLYPALLAGVWKLSPEHPGNIVAFKLVSAVFLSLSVVLAGALGTRMLGGVAPPVALAALAGASPLVLPFSDYPLTELPFLALSLAAIVLAARDEAGEGRSRVNALALGIVCGLAFLTRQAAVPLIAAGAIVYAARRRWRELWLFALATLVAALPWLVFRATAGPPPTNPLLAYYTSYEPSVLGLAMRDPGLAGGIVLANLYYLWTALDLAAYTRYAPAVRVLLYPILLLGLWRIFRRPVRFLPLFALLYGGLIVAWPWHPSRYAVPLAPLVPLAVLSAGSFLSARARASERRMDAGPEPVRRLERAVWRALPWAPAGLLAVLAAGWLAAWSPREPGTTRMAFLGRLDYDWSGFEETAAWIAGHTSPDAVLATAYDPLYYLRAGRRGVRPWLHRPWTYFYPVGDSAPEIGTPAEVQAALDDLGADYLVIDPLDGYVEAEAAGELYRGLLARYAPPAYMGRAELRFVSADTLHRVYELPARRRPDEEDPAADGSRAPARAGAGPAAARNATGGGGRKGTGPRATFARTTGGGEMTSIGIGRLVPLAAALALAGAHPALAQDRMVEGTWTGTVYPPDGEVVPLEYAVAYGEEGLVIELIPPPEVAESVLATQILHDGETLTFTIEVINVVCTLYEEEEDGRYEGECVDESGDGGLMVMFPPGDPSRSGG